MTWSFYFLLLVFMASPTNGNPWFASTVGLAGLIVGYVIATGVNGIAGVQVGGTINPVVPTDAGAQQASVAPAVPDTPPTAGEDSPFLGKADAPVTFIEFTDFQCPFCQRHFQQTFEQIKTNYIDTGKIKYVTRHYPLGFHPNAQKASEAAACAQDQGKFWEMHKVLFAKQEEWSNLTAADADAKFKSFAADIGLTAAAFGTCLDTDAKADKVRQDLADGSASGIDGTPGFWVLGPDGQSQKISGAYPFATFQAAIDGMLD